MNKTNCIQIFSISFFEVVAGLNTIWFSRALFARTLCWRDFRKLPSCVFEIDAYLCPPVGHSTIFRRCTGRWFRSRTPRHPILRHLRKKSLKWSLNWGHIITLQNCLLTRRSFVQTFCPRFRFQIHLDHRFGAGGKNLVVQFVSIIGVFRHQESSVDPLNIEIVFISSNELEFPTKPYRSVCTPGYHPDRGRVSLRNCASFRGPN